MVTPTDSKTIDLLRLPCAVLVVFIHVFSSIGGGYVSYSESVYDFIRVLFSQGIARLAVPIFFLTSGFLFFQGFKQWDSKMFFAKIKKRFQTLFIPYILWNLILVFYYALIFVAKGNTSGLIGLIDDNGWLLSFWNCSRNNIEPRINLLGWKMWDGAFPINFPLWFIRDLMILNLFAPLVYFVVKKMRIGGVVILFVLYVIDIWIPLEGLRAEGFFFYTIGAFLCVNSRGLTEPLRKIRHIALLLSICTLPLCVFFYGSAWYWYVRRLFCTFGTVSAIWGMSVMVNRLGGKCCRFSPAFLSGASFFIFAAHMVGVKEIVCSLLNKVISLIPNSDSAVLDMTSILCYFSAPILISSVIMVIYFVLQKKVPVISSLLTGGRTRA